MLKRNSILLTALVAAVLLAQGTDDWIYEQVDGDSLNIRLRPQVAVGADGVIHVCYGASGAPFYHAWKDSVWHRETALRAPISAAFNLAVGRHGEVGVVFYVNPFGGSLYLAEKQDSTWVVDTTPYAAEWPTMWLAYDTAGIPCLSFGNWYADELRFAERRGRVWTYYTLAWFNPPYINLDGPSALIFDSLNRPYVSWAESYYPGGEGLFYIYRDQSGEWTTVSPNGSTWRAFDARDTNQIALFYDRGEAFYYNGEVLDTMEVRWALARLDSGARPHVVYPRGEALVHRYRYSGRWYCDTIMGTGEASFFSLAYSPSHELVLCFVRDNAPWIARRGLPTVSIAEDSPGQNLLSRPETDIPSIVRGSLFLPWTLDPSTPWTLFSITGRKVMELLPGENDIRHVAPGVYFLRSAGSGEQSAVRKVVIQR
jgi:hypothetical protein